MIPSLDAIMTELRSKRTASKRGKNPRKPVSLWSEKETLRSEIVDSFVIILNTTGCSWARKSGCTMCGYISDTCDEVGEKELSAQLEVASQRYEGQPYVKIFTSGSLLNPEEIPPSFARELLEFFSARAQKVCIETRAEFVNGKSVRWLSELPARIEVAMGVESTNDRIRQHILNKNMSMDDYIRASRVLRDLGLKVKTYLLLKPPLLSERESVEDCTRSVLDVLPYTDSISVNPVNVQRHTLVDYLHHRGFYRPPWYYSLQEVFVRCSKAADGYGTRLMSAPSGGGSRRGIHNCSLCDERYAEAIKAVSLGITGVEVFDRIDCRCRAAWQCDMDTQDAAGDFLSVG